MKTCPKCRTTYQDDKNFCRNCGVKLASEKTVNPKISARKTVFEERIKADPLNSELLLEFGGFLLENKDFNSAELIIYRALEIDKNNISIKKLLFKCLRVTGKADEATEIGI